MAGEFEMDDTYWAIIDALQPDGRMSFSELGRRVHLSAPAVAERVRRLEEAGVISRYRAVIDSTKLGWTVRAFVMMSCHGVRCVLRDPEVLTWPELVSVDRVTGDSCSVLRVRATSIEHFESVIDQLASYGRPSSLMVLSHLHDWQPIARRSE